MAALLSQGRSYQAIQLSANSSVADWLLDNWRNPQGFALILYEGWCPGAGSNHRHADFQSAFKHTFPPFIERLPTNFRHSCRNHVAKNSACSAAATSVESRNCASVIMARSSNMSCQESIPKAARCSPSSSPHSMSSCWLPRWRRSRLLERNWPRICLWFNALVLAVFAVGYLIAAHLVLRKQESFSRRCSRA
jgi:hypothetical protein